MEKKKLCFFCPNLFPLYNKLCKVNYGGTEIQIFLIIEELSKLNNFEINIIVGDYDVKKIKKYYSKNYKIYLSIPILNPLVRQNYCNILRRPLNIFLTLLKINPKIIIIRGIGLPTSFTKAIAGFFCMFLRKRIIFSVASEREVNGSLDRGLRGILYKLFFDNVNYIILQNHQQFYSIKRWRKKKYKNIGVIKNSYTIPEKNNYSKKSILWVGRAAKVKSPEIFIDLAKQFPNEEFVMICPKDVHYNYWNYIHDLACKINNLKFYEFVPFKKIEEYFKVAKVFINTSEYEGFPNTFIQAFITNTPIISLNVDPDSILEKNRVGLFCHSNYNELIDNLELLLKNSEIYKKISNNAYSYAEKNHNIKENILKWKRIIEGLIMD